MIKKYAQIHSLTPQVLYSLLHCGASWGETECLSCLPRPIHSNFCTWSTSCCWHLSLALWFLSCCFSVSLMGSSVHMYIRSQPVTQRKVSSQFLGLLLCFSSLLFRTLPFKSQLPWQHQMPASGPQPSKNTSFFLGPSPLHHGFECVSEEKAAWRSLCVRPLSNDSNTFTLAWFGFSPCFQRLWPILIIVFGERVSHSWN